LIRDGVFDRRAFSKVLLPIVVRRIGCRSGRSLQSLERLIEKV